MERSQGSTTPTNLIRASSESHIPIPDRLILNSTHLKLTGHPRNGLQLTSFDGVPDPLKQIFIVLAGLVKILAKTPKQTI